jgi:hypothetical protein
MKGEFGRDEGAAKGKCAFEILESHVHVSVSFVYVISCSFFLDDWTFRV